MSLDWQKIEDLFHQALARPASERSAYLRSVCPDPSSLREVESLLRHEAEHTDRFAAPIQPVAAELWNRTEEVAAPGDLFGPYRVVASIGNGGMGNVYLAVDTRLQRQVALKRIRRAYADTPQARARFLQEAQSAAVLAHPNIAVVHDFGETDGVPWLVMEYVAGQSLRARLAAAPVSHDELLNYATQIAAALQHAHSREILHRDVKPENIIVTHDGTLKLVDFGLARPMGNVTLSDAEAHVFMGTLAYAAPELLQGASATPESDVYALGVILWEVAYGARPADAPGPAAAIPACTASSNGA